MKIINGRDYYDSAMVYGIDPNVIFIRDDPKQRIIDINELSENGFNIETVNCRIKFKNDRYSRHIEQYDGFFKRIEFFSIFIGNKKFNGVSIEFFSIFEKNKIFYDYHKFKEYVESLNFKLVEDNDRFFEEVNVEKFFKNNYVSTKATSFLIDNKISVMIVKPMNDKILGVSVNISNLTVYEFYKIMDPVTIVQELSMWIGGILSNNENKMVEIKDEKILLKKHGFDRWSFKKMKQKT